MKSMKIKPKEIEKSPSKSNGKLGLLNFYLDILLGESIHEENVGDDSEEQSIFLLNPSNYVLKKSDKNKATRSVQTKGDFKAMIEKFNVRIKNKSLQTLDLNETGFDKSVQTIDFNVKHSKKVKKEIDPVSQKNISGDFMNKLLILEDFYGKISKFDTI